MTIESPETETASPVEARASRRAWLVVAIFLLFYTLSFIDRSIINMMVGPLEKQVGLSDFKISLLMGPAFGLFYVICGLPMGWLVDRFSRRWLAMGGVFVWSLATIACGFAANFTHLFIGRMGVGVGEAALTPAAHSIIAEEFPAKRLSLAISIYTMGATIGAGLATLVGGAVVHLIGSGADLRLPALGVTFHPWQLVFLIVGVATLAAAPLGLLIRSSIARGSHAHAARADLAAKASVVTSRTIWSLLGRHWQLYLAAPLGFGFSTIIIGAYAGWIPTFMMRTYHWNAAQVGAAWGIQHMLAGIPGYLLGSYLVDRMFAAGVKDAHMRFHIFGLALAIPTAIGAFYTGNPWAFMVLTGFFYMFVVPYVGYGAAALQLYTPTHLRGQVSAVYIAIVTILGTFVGAPATAWLTDFVFKNKARVDDSMIVVTLACTPFAVGLLLIAAAKMRRLAAEQAAFIAALPTG